MRTSVISVTHNSAAEIVPLAASVPPDAELVIVDNASSDHPAAAVAGCGREVTFAELPSNGGFGRGCNVGAGIATGDVLVFLNPDCRLSDATLVELSACVEDDRANIYGPALVHEDGSAWHNLRRRSTLAQDVVEQLPSARRWAPWRLRRDLPPEDPAYGRRGEVDYLQGACLAIDRRLFLQIGGFDEDFFLYSEEETLCEAVQRHGGRCVYLADAPVIHVGATSTDGVREFALRHLYRSRAIFYRKRHGELRGLLSCVVLAAAVALNGAILGLRPGSADRPAPSPRAGLRLDGLVEGMLHRLGRL